MARKPDRTEYAFTRHTYGLTLTTIDGSIYLVNETGEVQAAMVSTNTQEVQDMKTFWAICKYIVLFLLITAMIPVVMVAGATIWYHCEKSIVNGFWVETAKNVVTTEYDLDGLLGKGPTDIEEQYGAFEFYMRTPAEGIQTVKTENGDTYWAGYRLKGKFDGIFYDEYSYFFIRFEKGRATEFAIAMYPFEDTEADPYLIEVLPES